MKPLADIYRDKISAGEVDPDPEQEEVVLRLDKLAQLLKGYKPGGSGLFSKKKQAIPHGFYFYGDVGRGKTMLMDLFFDAAPVKQKRRVHFHAFMLEVHDELHKLREQAKGSGVDAALEKITAKIAKDAWLLCFDEFFVDDVADAMILGRLFTLLFEQGVVVVATSNCAPDDLYKDGLQRDRFEPFIELLHSHMDVVRFSGGRDYRLDRLKDLEVYHYPNDEAAARIADDVYETLTDGAESRTFEIEVRGRKIPVPAAAKCVARFDFTDLCEQPRGAADFLELARHFHTIILENVPAMTDEHRNEALRFVTLIDVLYEQKLKLVITAEVVPEELYSGQQHDRAFKRTVSRLMEMQAEDYLSAV